MLLHCICRFWARTYRYNGVAGIQGRRGIQGRGATGSSKLPAVSDCALIKSPVFISPAQWKNNRTTAEKITLILFVEWYSEGVVQHNDCRKNARPMKQRLRGVGLLPQRRLVREAPLGEQIHEERVPQTPMQRRYWSADQNDRFEDIGGDICSMFRVCSRFFDEFQMSVFFHEKILRTE